MAASPSEPPSTDQTMTADNSKTNRKVTVQEATETTAQEGKKGIRRKTYDAFVCLAITFLAVVTFSFCCFFDVGDEQ